MSDSLQMPSMRGESDVGMFTCKRHDAWSCSNLFTMLCGDSCPVNSDGKGKTDGIHQKGVKTMKPKKPKGKC